MKSQEEQTKILVQVSMLLNKGYESEFENIITSIKSKEENETMPDGLKKIYDEVKNTPIEEKELYDMSKQIANKELSIIDFVLRFLSDDEIDKYSISDISFFAGKVIRKVESLKDENGIFKSTPNTQSWQPPKPSYVKKIDMILKQAGKGNEDELAKQLDAILLESSGVDTSLLTDWELQLVKSQTEDAYRGYLNSFLGKR